MTHVKLNNHSSKSFDGLMKELFNDFPNAMNKNWRHEALHFPPVNIVEKTESYQLELAAPGLAKSDFNVKLDENILTIAFEQKAAKEENNDKIIRSEFALKSFKRSFSLDEQIDVDNIAARYENGILLLLLPKKEVAKVIAKKIDIL